MSTITIKGLPAALHRTLKSRARTHGRSLNKEIIATLESALKAAPAEQPAQVPIITLLTDFGLADGYVAEVKGVIASAAPELRVIDACHEIPFADVAAGAWVLGEYWAQYPEGTVHVAMVDPGVGSERRILLAEADGHLFIAPDNGLLTRVLQQAKKSRVAALRKDVHRPGIVSPTFHGRDIQAWAAAWLASGAKTVADLSEPVEQWVRLDLFTPKVSEKGIEGAVVHIDHFGNVITNITRDLMEARFVSGRAGPLGQPSSRCGAPSGRALPAGPWTTYLIRAGACEIVGLRTTYADIPPGQPAALWGSSDHLEISMAGESAAHRLGIQRGDPVCVQRKVGGR